MNKIIEIIEIGTPRSLIQRESNATSELIDNEELIEELNDMLRPMGYLDVEDLYKEEEKIEPLPIERQIRVLKQAKEHLRRISHYYARLDGGLCNILSNCLDVTCEKPQLYIPIFTFENAIKYSGAFKLNYWWDEGDEESRIKFLDWMLSELEKQLNNK